MSDGTNKVKTPKTITIYLSYQNQENYAYFDNICLVKDNAMSYTYDKDGKVISVVDNSKKQSTMEYNNSDLTKNIDAKGYAYTYGYDKAHNVTKATSQTGMNYNYTYAKGLATSLEVKCDPKVTDVGILKSEVTYDSNGLLSSATDQDGNKVEYKYDGNKGTLTQTTDKLDSKNPVVTDYTYDSNTDQIKSVKQSDSSGNEYSIAYSYSSKSKLLEKISRDGTDYSIKYDEFGNKIDSKVGSQSLASYSYGSNNGPLLSLTYGTGQNVSYAYDEFGNVETRKYNGKTAFNWYSDRGGNIIRENDYLNKRLTDFTYDTTGRLVRQTVADSSVTGSSNKLLFGFEYSYDLNNNITQVVTKTTDKTVKNKFTFVEDNLLKTFELSTGKKVDYTYDGLNRLTKTSLTTSANTPIDTTYTYFASKRCSDYTTTKLKSETINGEKYEYKYDARSNITDVTKDGVLQYHYGYDMMNQLVSVDDKLNGKVYNYTYDAGGNLISETVTDSNGTTSNAYEYNNSNWGDVLTSYNGQNITYDEIGNPLTYRDGMSMTWKNGRQLTTLTNGDTSISYGYDSDSVRATKTVNGVKYTYAYLNGQLMYETRGDAKFYYSYDANGILYNVRYTLTDGGTEYSYYYTHNSRGDIVGIYNGAGKLKAHYEYDAWGNVISITDNNGNAITNPNHIGNLNPFRYRGYYQDTETGLYYLMSRYYDAVTHRFINADGYFQSGGSILDANTFAYCANNPVLNVDPLGTCKVPNYTSAGTYIGHTWKIKKSVPGVPGFCNVCKGYGSNAPSNTSHSFVISSYTTPSTKKQDYNTWNKVADSFGAIFCSLEVDFDAGFGFGFDVTDIFSIKAMGKHTLISVHFDEQGFSFGKTDSVEVSAGVCGWDLFGVQDTKFYENGSGNEYENFGSSHKIGFSKGDYVGVGATIGFGWNLDYIYNRFCEIWG